MISTCSAVSTPSTTQSNFRLRQRSITVLMMLRALGGGLRIDGAVTAPQPDQAADYAGTDQNAGKHDGEDRRRVAEMRERQRNRIHAQDEVEQRDLARKRRELRFHQFVIVSVNSKQLGKIAHEAANEDRNPLMVPQRP